MGINEWLIPQISEHCPKNNPGEFIKKIIWLRWPGVASILIPNEGIVQEWITSEAVTIIWICNFIGKIICISVSIIRKLDFLNVNFKNELNSEIKKFEYSYFQNHWFPIIFRVIEGKFISSSKYNNRKEGKIIILKIDIGIIVQIISIFWLNLKNWLVYLFIIIKIIKYKIIKIMIIKINIKWSWKNKICSIKGEFLFWKYKFVQVEIINKNLYFIYEI